MDLAEFLLARINEDAQLARDSLQAGLERDGERAEWMELQYDHTALTISPARVLADCEAKRRIVERCENYDGDELLGDDVLRLLALPYADHPDFDENWRP